MECCHSTIKEARKCAASRCFCRLVRGQITAVVEADRRRNCSTNSFHDNPVSSEVKASKTRCTDSPKASCTQWLPKLSNGFDGRPLWWKVVEMASTKLLILLMYSVAFCKQRRGLHVQQRCFSMRREDKQQQSKPLSSCWVSGFDFFCGCGLSDFVDGVSFLSFKMGIKKKSWELTLWAS